MPKAKCDQTIGLRIELQKSERDILEAAALAQGLSGILQGVGSILTPFAGVLSAFAAAYIASEGVGAILGWANSKLAEKENAIDDEYAAYVATKHAAETATDRAGNLLSPGPHRADLTRAEYENLFGRANMTNWEKIKYDVAGEVPGTATSRSELDRNQADICTVMTKMFGRKAAEDAGYCPIPPV